MKRDYLAWAALVAALAVTASAEYTLARACGFGQVMAAGVPAALDVYAVRALRVHRDVFAVVLAMIGVNAASHLVTAGLLPVSVPLVVAVSAIAPLVLWRVHALREDAEQTAEDEPVPAEEAPPVPAAVPVVERVPDPVPAPGVQAGTPYPEIAAGVPEDEQGRQIVLPPDAEPVPVYPAAGPDRTRPEVRAEYVPEPVPAEDELTANARVDFGGLVPSVRNLRARYGIGQTRAQRIRDELEGHMR